MRPVLYAAILAVLSLVGLEAVARLSYDSHQRLRLRLDTPADGGRWVTHPFFPIGGGADGAFKVPHPGAGMSERIVTNSYGFATHEFPDRKAAGEYTVVCLGDATTYTYDEIDRQTWVEHLEARLRDRHPDRQIRVFNLGQDTATTAASVATLALVGAHLQPDLVIVYHGANDLVAIGTEDFSPDHAHAFKQFDPTVIWEGFDRRVPRWMLSSYALGFALGVPDPAWYADIGALVRTPRREAADRFKGIEATLGHLNTVQAIAKGGGGRALFSTFAFQERDDPSRLRFNEMLRRFFDERGLAYVDQAALLPSRDPTVQLDDLRYTARGAQLLAQNFSEFIEAHGLVR